jgi:ribonuclease HI
MTYAFPEMLRPLRDYLKSCGFAGDSIKTSRQAAFVAQQLLGSRIKFPPQGCDMMPTLMLIQKALADRSPNASASPLKQVKSPTPKALAEQASKAGRKPAGKGGKSKQKPAYLTAFSPAACRVGIHIFADGAAVPNPGAGGWAYVVYIDGIEFKHAFGGDPNATNNQMELTALLNAIESAVRLDMVPAPNKITIWSDSEYCVNGANEWLTTWKARGWNKFKLNSPKREEGVIKNMELWQAIDTALSDPRAANIKIYWVKGHAGHVGNERADELAEMGRQSVQEMHELVEQDLDAEYRAVMAG